MDQFMLEDKIISETTLLYNPIILMKVYNMTIQAKDCCVKSSEESIYLHGQHVTEFLTISCMFANE